MKKWKKVFNGNGNENNAEYQYSDRTNVKTKTVRKDKEGHYIVIKGLFQEEDITFINICATKLGMPKYIKQVLTNLKGEASSNIIIEGDFNTPQLHQWVDHPGRISIRTHRL